VCAGVCHPHPLPFVFFLRFFFPCVFGVCFLFKHQPGFSFLVVFCLGPHPLFFGWGLLGVLLRPARLFFFFFFGWVRGCEGGRCGFCFFEVGVLVWGGASVGPLGGRFLGGPWAKHSQKRFFHVSPPPLPTVFCLGCVLFLSALHLTLFCWGVGVLEVGANLGRDWSWLLVSFEFFGFGECAVWQFSCCFPSSPCFFLFVPFFLFIRASAPLFLPVECVVVFVERLCVACSLPVSGAVRRLVYHPRSSYVFFVVKKTLLIQKGFLIWFLFRLCGVLSLVACWVQCVFGGVCSSSAPRVVCRCIVPFFVGVVFNYSPNSPHPSQLCL